MLLTRYLDVIPLIDNQYLVLNFLSGDGVITDIEEITALQNLKFNNDEENYWRDRGYLFDSKEEEKKEVERLLALCQTMETKYAPPVATVIPTYNCNCACSYCFEGTTTRRNETLTDSMVEAIFTHLKRENSSGRLNISLFGGEPLLVENTSLISHILSECEKSGAVVSVITNGTTLDNYVEILKRYHSTISHLQVTIDGPPEVHDKRKKLRNGQGTFDLIMNNIDIILDEVPDINILARTNMSRVDSIRNPVNLFNIYKERHLTTQKRFGYYLKPITQSYGGCLTGSCVTDHFDFILEIIQKIYLAEGASPEMKWNMGLWQETLLRDMFQHKGMGYPLYKGCGAASSNSLVFGPEGSLYACWEEIGHKERAIGTWYPEWQIGDYGTEWRSRSVVNIPECRDCQYAFVCSGGCGKIAEKKHGRLNAPSCQGIAKERTILHQVAQAFTKQYQKQASLEN